MFSYFQGHLENSLPRLHRSQSIWPRLEVSGAGRLSHCTFTTTASTKRWCDLTVPPPGMLCSSFLCSSIFYFLQTLDHCLCQLTADGGFNFQSESAAFPPLSLSFEWVAFATSSQECGTTTALVSYIMYSNSSLPESILLETFHPPPAGIPPKKTSSNKYLSTVWPFAPKYVKPQRKSHKGITTHTFRVKTTVVTNWMSHT